MKIGRNDPCHCGSGKKYKLCHLPLEESERRSSVAETTKSAVSAASPGEGLEEAVQTLRELRNTGDAKRKAEAERLLARTEPVLNFLKRQSEIEAAAKTLEAYQQDLVELSKDNAAYQNRIETVFAEDRFMRLRFSVEELQRAFDQLGSPLAVPKEKVKEHLGGIVLHLANKEYRTVASLNLLVFVPDYLAAERHIDGCLVLACGRMTADQPNETNPFLWQMFVHGYHAWTAAKQARLGG